MPIDYTENVWNALYGVLGPEKHRISDGVVEIPAEFTGYTRSRFYFGGYDPTTLQRQTGTDAPQFSKRKDWLTGYGLDNNARVGVIGCGLGFLNEYLIDQGITDTWGIEPSQYVWDSGELRADVEAQMIQATVGVDSTSTIQGLLQAKGYPNPRTFDWIIDEDAISSQIDDAGIAAFLAGCEDLLQGNVKGRIVHLVSPAPGRDTQILWKSMAEWQAYAPDHTWVDLRGDGSVF